MPVGGKRDQERGRLVWSRVGRRCRVYAIRFKDHYG